MDPNNITAATELNDVEAAVRALGGNTVVGKATSGREVEAAFAMFVQRRLGRYTSAVARSLTANASEFIALAARHALPAISVFRACLSNKTALAMIFKLAQAAEKSWHRLRGHNQLPKVILGVKFNHGIEVVRSQAQAATA
jgi:hypothetical protein